MTYRMRKKCIYQFIEAWYKPSFVSALESAVLNDCFVSSDRYDLVITEPGRSIMCCLPLKGALFVC